jgi:transcriptional regulator with XRE-family HTH domain
MLLLSRDYRENFKMEIFKNRLLELRKLNKYTQKQMAELLNIAQPSYIRYENGSAEPTFAKLSKLADIFDVSTDYLLGRKDI